MANANTFAGFQNLPAVTWTYGSTETGYVIPAAGTYPSLPSPTQVAANWLCIPALAGDVTGGVLDYARPFRVRVNMEINSAQSENITLKIYQATAAKFAAGITATANGTAIATTGTMATGGAIKGNCFLDAVCLWDSQSKALTGYYYGYASAKATPAVIAVTTFSFNVASLNESDLNFFFTITAGTGTSDVFGPIDFTIDRY
jgi:hypothetical protein